MFQGDLVDHATASRIADVRPALESCEGRRVEKHLLTRYMKRHDVRFAQRLVQRTHRNAFHPGCLNHGIDRHYPCAKGAHELRNAAPDPAESDDGYRLPFQLAAEYFRPRAAMQCLIHFRQTPHERQHRAQRQLSDSVNRRIGRRPDCNTESPGRNKIDVGYPGTNTRHDAQTRPSKDFAVERFEACYQTADIGSEERPHLSARQLALERIVDQAQASAREKVT